MAPGSGHNAEPQVVHHDDTKGGAHKKRIAAGVQGRASQQPCLVGEANGLLHATTAKVVARGVVEVGFN